MKWVNETFKSNKLPDYWQMSFSKQQQQKMKDNNKNKERWNDEQIYLFI